MATDEISAPFRGFRSPSYTQVPDELFDELLPTLSGAELKVLLYIIRRTFGFKREADAISLSQMLHGIARHDGRILDRGVGLSKPTLLVALRSLVARSIIETERRRSEAKGDEPTVYRLKFVGEDTPAPDGGVPVGKKFDQGVVKELNQGVVNKFAPPVVKKSAPQETVEQQTDEFFSNIRMGKNAELNVDNSGSHEDKPSRTASPSPVGEGEAAPKTNRSTIVKRNDTGLVADSPQAPTDMETVGAVLKRGRGRPPKEAYDEERAQIAAYIQDFAREMGDTAPLKSSVTRAYNLYTQSGWPISRFIDALYQARAKTKERSAQIKARPDPAQPFAPKARMAYYFALLEDELGMREDGQPVSPVSQSW